MLVSRVLLLSFALVLAGCSQIEDEQDQPRFAAKELAVRVGGRPAIELSRVQESSKRAQILSVVILPGRGMNVFQVRAFIPGRGVIPLLEAPTLEEAAKRMNGGPDDFMGNESFKMGGALLVPYANRIRGKFDLSSRTIETVIAGKDVTLPANWKGREPGAEPHAMHGLIMNKAMQAVTWADAKSAQTRAEFDAGDFGGHWPSKTALTIAMSLAREGFEFSVTAKNTGNAPLPLGIGWHPYFVFPSGDREQVRLHIPARLYALVNNYDDVFPTGKIVPVKGTPYDFTQKGGARLGKLFLDDCFLDLEREKHGEAVAEITDPAAKYGLRIRSLSRHIRAFQAYTPVDRPFIALEPQFNLGDPYGKIWPKDQNTGMALVEPGQSVTYRVRLEVFVP